MKIPTLEVLIGISGSGKSTYANNKKGFTIISTDAIREELFGDPSIQDNGKLVFQIAYDRVKNSLKSGNDTIFDATNLKAKDRKKLLNYLIDNEVVFNTIFVVFTIPLNICVERAQHRRINPIPEGIIKRQYSKFQLPSMEESATIVEIIYVYEKL